MVEIRTYEGGAEELAQLCADVWRADFGGTESMPVWDAPFFQWQLIADRPGGRDYLLAAYDEAKLVGVLLAEPFTFRVRRAGEAAVDVLGSMGSWLSVQADYRPFGAGLQLIEAMRERHLERGAAFCLGFVVGGDDTGAGKFWGAYARSFPESAQRMAAMGSWVRGFDHRALADWTYSAPERWLSRAMGLVQSGRVERPSDAAGVRPYRADDLPACLGLAHALLDEVDFGYVWTAERLALQLEYRGTPRTLVVERGGAVVGYLNWYKLGSTGRRRVELGMIDLLVMSGLTSVESRALLETAMADMVEAGCHCAVTLRLPNCRAGPLLGAGFVPVPASVRPMALVADPKVSLAGLPRVHLHVR